VSLLLTLVWEPSTHEGMNRSSFHSTDPSTSIEDPGSSGSFQQEGSLELLLTYWDTCETQVLHSAFLDMGFPICALVLSKPNVSINQE
jgi:hypothetical protein